MPTCSNPKCGKRLDPVRRPNGTWSERHPAPQCDPDGPDWPDLSPAPARQEATPT